MERTKKLRMQGARRRENESVADLSGGAKGGEGRSFIRNHLCKQAEIGGGEKIKDAAAATETRCRYQRRAVALLPPVRGNSPLRPGAVGFSVTAPSTVIKGPV